MVTMASGILLRFALAAAGTGIGFAQVPTPAADGAARALGDIPGAPLTLRLDTRPPDFLFTFKPVAKVPGQRRLALALGGGAAKGIAHAGVLQRLEEEGLPPDSIAGTSMGAFMGGMYGVGYSGYSLQDLLQRVDLGAVLLDRQRRSLGETLWEQETQTATIFSMEYNRREGFSFEPGSSSGLELKRSLQWLLSRGLYYAGPDLDQLRVPFRAVSTNLQKGSADAPKQVSIVDAVRASMCIPGMFRPVVFGGEQHVDGMLVENLPVYESKRMDPAAVVLGVEVGSQLDAVKSSTVFSVLLRTLDVTIEERTRLSRLAADVLLRPDTTRLSYLEFNKQVPEGVDLGRRSFDERLPDLEARLYGADGDLPAPNGTPILVGPADLLTALRALADRSLPQDATRTRRDYYRWLRRIHAAGLAREAAVMFVAGQPPLLKVEPHPPLRGVLLEVPEDWRGHLTEALRREEVRVGARFNPARLGRALDRFLLEAALAFRPTLDLRATRFDSTSGMLKVSVQEPRIAGIRIAPGILRPGDERYLSRLMANLQGEPLDARRLFLHTAMAESRLNLEELVLGGEASDAGPVLILTPVPRQRLTFDVSLAYESTWGFHAGVDSHMQNFLGTGSSFDLQASTNRLQDALAFEFSRAFRNAPRLAVRLFTASFQQRFLPEGLKEPAVLSPFGALLADRTVRAQDLGVGLQQRFGSGDRGLGRIDFSRRWSDILPGFEGSATAVTDHLQLSGEWDDFDRYTFPTRGRSLRALAGLGRDRTGSNRPESFQWFYGRGQGYFPVASGASLHLDAEAGLGWNPPLDRWYSLGGPGFLVGTRSAGFLSPNFSVVRLGLPVRLADMFGFNTWLEPRIDAGYLGGGEPRQLREGTRVRAIGASLKTEIGRFYVEVAAGRSWLAPEGRTFRSTGDTVNLLVGTRPWDLWKRR